MVFQSPTLMPWARVATTSAALELATCRAPPPGAESTAGSPSGLSGFAGLPARALWLHAMRAAIARALAQAPDLCEDEPSRVLDYFTARARRELRECGRARLTVVFVPHASSRRVTLDARAVRAGGPGG